MPHPDFTPDLNQISNRGSFRFWCQKVLPLVYDDSLSYYELLCKVIEYLNNTMNDVRIMGGNIDALKEAYTNFQNYIFSEFDTFTSESETKYNEFTTNITNEFNNLQNYVDTFFDELDLTEEVSDKLDEMAASGALSNLLAPLIPSIVTNWLSENVTPVGSAVVVDASLSIQGAAADAKVTGDNFKNVIIKQGVSTDLNNAEYLVQGVFALSAGREYVNAPPFARNIGWLLRTFTGLYSNNVYVSQFLSDQTGKMWHRYISRQGTNPGSWYQISSRTTVAPSNDFNDAVYKMEDGVYIFPANTQLANSPNDAFKGGWVLEVITNVFTNNDYTLQTARDQYGTTYSRYISMSSSAKSTWFTIGQPKNTVYMSFGDSITAGHGVSTPYSAIVGQYLGAYLTRNAGVSSTGWLDNTGGRIAYEQIIRGNYDSVGYVTLAWGINDYRTAKIIGSVATSEEGDTTVIGQMIKALKWLQVNHPDVLTVVLLPINITEVGNISTNFAMNYANSNGDTLADFISAMKECCDYMQIPYIDINKYSGFGTYSLDSYLLDTVHPTQEAHYRIAGIVKQHFPSANLKN